MLELRSGKLYLVHVLNRKHQPVHVSAHTICNVYLFYQLLHQLESNYLLCRRRAAVVHSVDALLQQLDLGRPRCHFSHERLYPGSLLLECFTMRLRRFNFCHSLKFLRITVLCLNTGHVKLLVTVDHTNRQKRCLKDAKEKNATTCFSLNVCAITLR
jgi:hypothetical protein